MRAARPRWRRLAAVALLCALIAPGTWWRAETRADSRTTLSVEPLDWQQPDDWPRTLTLAGVWQLDSTHPAFGGFSALLALPEGRLVAYSDAGWMLDLAMPGRAGGPARFVKLPQHPAARWHDIESATRDPISGTRWFGLETINALRRLPAQGGLGAAARPPEMAGWPGNSGAEAMLRLLDGRFIVLGERKSRLSSEAGPGLLFAGDPVEGAEAVRFAFHPPDGYQPTDMASLPDGRVLILLRALDLGFPPFACILVVADPRVIRGGEAWAWQLFARFSPPLPRENYEGVGVMPLGSGAADIWIIADDNEASLQRTLLVRLHWQPGEARTRKGAPEAPFDAP